MIHFFDTEIAEAYGVNCAILFNHIWYWCAKNRSDERNFHDDNYWTHMSIRGMRQYFPYMSKKVIETSIKKLVDNGMIVKGNYNATPTDRTTWYAITPKGKLAFPEKDFSISQNGEMVSKSLIYNNSITDNNPNKNQKGLNNTNVLFNCEKPKVSHDDIEKVLSAWNALSDIGIMPVSRISANSQRYRWTIGRILEHGVDEVLRAIENVRKSGFLRSGSFNFSYDWFIRPNNFVKVLDGNYLDKDYRKVTKKIEAPEPEEEEELTDEEWLKMMEGE